VRFENHHHHDPPDDEDGDATAPPWLVEFLATLIVSGRVAEAVASAGIDFETAWALRRSEPEFAMYWDKAVHLHRSGAMEALVLGEQRGAMLQ